jgi:tetratricopeptide (TPR) repeat protein
MAFIGHLFSRLIESIKRLFGLSKRERVKARDPIAEQKQEPHGLYDEIDSLEVEIRNVQDRIITRLQEADHESARLSTIWKEHLLRSRDEVDLLEVETCKLQDRIRSKEGERKIADAKARFIIDNEIKLLSLRREFMTRKRDILFGGIDRMTNLIEEVENVLLDSGKKAMSAELFARMQRQMGALLAQLRDADQEADREFSKLSAAMQHCSQAPLSTGSSQQVGGVIFEGPTRMRIDDNVQFTVFRPEVVTPRKWHPLLAFAHLSKRPPDAPPDEPDPMEEVRRQAHQILGERLDDYCQVVQDSRDAVPAAGEITFLPEISDVEFNPPRATFIWQESVHRQEFRLLVGPELVGQTARGRLTVFLGTRIIADVSLAIRVEAQVQEESRKPEAASARPYRKVFASYSHKDLPVVEEFEHYLAAFGDEYLRDSVTLRAGEVWNDRLAEMIREADIFQLFWSSNSMRSKYVQQEWEHALSLNRAHFVRPVYWEEPRPKDEAQGLPPAELSRLHFQRLCRHPRPTDKNHPRLVDDILDSGNTLLAARDAMEGKMQEEAERLERDAVADQKAAQETAERNPIVEFERPEAEEAAMPLHDAASSGHGKTVEPLRAAGEENEAEAEERKRASLVDETGKTDAKALHRGIKPSNILLEGDREPRISDFGIARSLEGTGTDGAAELQYRRTLETSEATLGPEHPETLVSLNNLAELLMKRGQYAEAEPLYRRALDAYDRVFGSEHPDTLATVYAFARLLRSRGDYAGAEPLFIRALQAKQMAGQDDGPEFAIELNNYALLVRHLGRFDEAAQLLLRAIAIEDRKLPPDHPKRAHRRNNLAIVWMLADQLDEAERVNAQAWSLKGDQHDVTSGRILFVRIALIWLQNTDATQYLGQLRTLLALPELPCLGEIDPQWDAADVLSHLRTRLSTEKADFVTAIVAALNEPRRVIDLEQFEFWRSAAGVSLEELWPKEP